MNRKKILNLLSQYIPSEEEVDYKKDMINFIENNINCFDRSNLNGHMTASAWVIDLKNQYCLLLHHKKLDLWFQPGGHADGESDLLAVAIKEVNEETGILDLKCISDGIFDIDIHEIPEYKGIRKHLHYDVRFLLQVENNNIIKNDESFDLKWFPKDRNKLPNKQKSILRMFDKWIKIII